MQLRIYKDGPNMRLNNETDVPDAWIRDAFAYCKPQSVGRLRDINFKRTRGMTHGQAHPAWNAIDIKVGRAWEHRGRTVPRRGGYLTFEVWGMEETLIAIIAHECRHLWQYGHTRGRTWNARGRYSERDADAYALRTLRRWRREQAKAVWEDGGLLKTFF